MSKCYDFCLDFHESRHIVCMRIVEGVGTRVVMVERPKWHISSHGNP